MGSDSSLAAFIASNPDARELKRALAVQMTLLGFKPKRVVSVPFLSTSRTYTGAMPVGMLGDGRVNGVRCALKMNGNDKPIMGPWMWLRAPSSCKATRRRIHSIRWTLYAIYNSVVPVRRC